MSSLDEFIKHRQAWYYWDFISRRFASRPRIRNQPFRGQELQFLSRNPNITWEIVQANPLFHWDYLGLSENPNITWEIVQANSNEDWSYIALSANPNITWDIIASNPNQRWSLDKFSSNPNVTEQLIREEPIPQRTDGHGTTSRWNFWMLSKNPSVTWEIVQALPDKKWDYIALSANPNIDWNIIKSNPERPWNIQEFLRFGKYSFEELREILEFTSGDVDPEFLANSNIGTPMIEKILASQLLEINYVQLSKNPNLTWKIISENLSYDWDFKALSSHMDWETIRTHPELPWGHGQLSENPNITWDNVREIPELFPVGGLEHFVYNQMTVQNELIREEILSYGGDLPLRGIRYSTSRDKIAIYEAEKDPNAGELKKYIKDAQANYFWAFIKENWEHYQFNGELSMNPNVTMEVIEKEPNFPRDYFLISRNPNVTWSWILRNPHHHWSLAHLSANPGITWLDIETNLALDWQWDFVSQNPNVTWEIVQANPDLPWHYFALSDNPNITDEIIQQNRTRNWKSDARFRASGYRDFPPVSDREAYFSISADPNLPWEIVRDNPDKPWNYSKLSENKNVTWDVIQNNPRIRWNPYLVSMNPSITWEIVRANPQFPWNYMGLSVNSNITCDIIRENPDLDWDLDQFLINPLTLQNKRISDTILLEEEQRLSQDFEAVIAETRNGIDPSLVELMLNVMTQQTELLRLRSN